MDLARGIFDAEARAERHLAERQADLGFGRHLLESRLGVRHLPPQLGRRALDQRLITSDGVARAISRFELDKRGMVALYFEPEYVNEETPGGLDVGHVLERED